jgi:hypothetical protein
MCKEKAFWQMLFARAKTEPLNYQVVNYICRSFEVAPMSPFGSTFRFRRMEKLLKDTPPSKQLGAGTSAIRTMEQQRLPRGRT